MSGLMDERSKEMRRRVDRIDKLFKEGKLSAPEAITRELSHLEKILEEAGRQKSQIREIYVRLVNIRECLVGSVPVDPNKELPPPMVAGVFGSLYIALYESGQSIEGIYDELRGLEKCLGIVAEKHPEPPRLGKIGR